MAEYRGDCFLVPGPVRMNQNCLDAMATPVITARGKEFREVMAELNSGLRYAFNLTPSKPEKHTQSWSGEDDFKVMAISGSGTAAMEMIIANRFRPNDLVLVPTNGKFGERVAEMCKRFCNVKHIKYDWGRAFDLYELEQQLERKCYEALLICHNETSSGITQDAPAIAEMCNRYQTSFILDGITSIGGLPVDLAAWNVEAAAMGAQKCTAGPSGIAAIAFNSRFHDRCKAIKEQGDINALFYLDFISAYSKGDDDQTPWTPAINLAMGWSAALNTLKEEGLAKRWERCQNLSNGVQNLFSDLGFELLAELSQRSPTVTAILYPEGINDSWRTDLKEKFDTQVIGAQDHLKGKMFRIGSMGETTAAEMIEGCKRMIECFKHHGHKLPDVDVASYF